VASARIDARLAAKTGSDPAKVNFVEFQHRDGGAAHAEDIRCPIGEPFVTSTRTANRDAPSSDIPDCIGDVSVELLVFDARWLEQNRAARTARFGDLPTRHAGQTHTKRSVGDLGANRFDQSRSAARYVRVDYATATRGHLQRMLNTDLPKS